MTYLILHCKEAIAPNAFQRKSLHYWPLLHNEHIKYLQVTCKRDVSQLLSPMPVVYLSVRSWSSPEVLIKVAQLPCLCTTCNLQLKNALP